MRGAWGAGRGARHGLGLELGVPYEYQGVDADGQCSSGRRTDGRTEARTSR